jgi:hypothetical protein
MGTHDKILFNALVSAVKGAPHSVRLHGTQEEIQAIREAVLASKRFHEALVAEDVEKIPTRLQERAVAVRRFRSVTGKNWMF